VSADANAGEQRHQVLDLGLLDRMDGLFDLIREVAADAAGDKLVESAGQTPSSAATGRPAF
jgi:hypothetical protein